jgi:hypothetical protein
VTRRAAALAGLVAWLVSMAWIASLPVYPSFGDGACGTSALGAVLGRGLAGCRGPALRLLVVWALVSAVAVAVPILITRTLCLLLRQAVPGERS